ncbi:anti-sigma factor RsbA family regulatory protein [Cryptosporangium minutisporangium]
MAFAGRLGEILTAALRYSAPPVLDGSDLTFAGRPAGDSPGRSGGRPGRANRGHSRRFGHVPAALATSGLRPDVPRYRGELTMTTSIHLSHEALFYGDDDELVAGVLPFVRAGLAQDQAVAAAVTMDNMTLLRGALGGDAAAVSFIDRDEWYQRPATTIAGWQRILAEANKRGHREVRLIGEVGFGTVDRHPTWTRYESALNSVFADAPASILCPYDTRALPAAVLADARRTHPVVSDPNRRDSDAYVAADRLLREVRESVPTAVGEPVLVMPVGASASPARRAVLGLLTGHDWADQHRLDDLRLVVSEIVCNSILHGGGHRELRVWISDQVVVCEVSDDGPGLPDPLIGYRPPVRTLTGGRGLWLARQLCDALSVETADGQTRVRFAVRLNSAGRP